MTSQDNHGTLLALISPSNPETSFLFFLSSFFPYCLNFLSNPNIIILLKNFNHYLNFGKEKEKHLDMQL